MSYDQSPEGGKEWTIKIKPGWTFHNGEPVTAESYIQAWNAAAYGPNAWVDGGEFANIKGYDALNPESGKPKTKELSGLTATDKTTIKVSLSKPDSQFPLELTTNAFLPMPDAAFKDLDAYDEAPIGDGPYQMVGKWQHNQQIEVKRYDGYKGTPGNADQIIFKIYTDDHAAFVAAQANQVDIVSIGQADYIQAKQVFGKNFIAFDAPAIDYLGFPLYNKYFSDKRIRQAISMAIDRSAINKAIFGGVNQPATSVLPPAEVGAPTGLCDYCTYNPDKAKQLLQQAGGWKGPLVIWYPSGAGYDQMFKAIANQLRQNLGITDITFHTAPFTPFLDSLTNKKVTNGIYRGHWGAYYPSMQNTLEALFQKTGAGYTETFYSSPQVDDLIAKGNAAPSLKQAQAAYVQAEKKVLDDVAVVPLFYAKYVYAHTDSVSNVIIDVNQVEVSDVVVNQ